MGKLVLGLVGAATCALATAVSAAITIGTNAPGTDPYSGPAPTFDFDTVGTTPTFTGGAVVSGTTPLVHAQPFGSTGSYYSVGLSDGATGTIDLTSFGDISSFSFIWGSVDTFNTLTFLGADGTTVLATFVGDDIVNPANGDQASPITNPLVTFLLTGSDVGDFSFLRLDSNNNAFEIDNLTVNSPLPTLNSVPEPASWALAILGFGAIGLTLRRRRKFALEQMA